MIQNKPLFFYLLNVPVRHFVTEEVKPDKLDITSSHTPVPHPSVQITLPCSDGHIALTKRGDGHLGCLHERATMSNLALDGVYEFWGGSVLSGL